MGLSLGEAVLELSADGAQLHTDIANAKQDAENQFTGFGNNLNSILTKGLLVGVAAVTTAIAGITVAGVKMAADLESQMAILSTAASDSGASLNDLHDAALAVGADTQLIGVTASGAADAMTGMFKAGLTSQEVFGDLNGYLDGTAELGGALRSSIDLAAASELDMVQASDLVVVAMKTFGLSADEARGVADNFVQTADASVASVSGLYEAMVNVGPTAAAFGWSLEDTNTALALLSTRGIQGAEAGTALKSMMTNIMRGTADTTAALNDLNIELYNTDGTMKELPDIIGQLSGAMSGLTEEQRNEYVQTLAGTYGMKAMNTLLTEGIPGWEAMEEAVAGAATVAEVSATRTATFQGRMEALGGAVETLKIGIGEAFLPVLTELADEFGVWVAEITPQVTAAFKSVGDWISVNLPIAFQKFADFCNTTLQPAFNGIWQVIQNDVLPFLGMLRDVFVNDIMPVVQQFVKDHAEELKAALQGIGVVIAGLMAAGAITSLGSAIAALANPITAVIAAGALLFAAWEGNWFGIRDIVTTVVARVSEVIDSLKPTIDAVVETISGLLSGDISLESLLPPEVADFLLNALENIKTTMNDVLLGAQDLWTSVTTTITTWVQANWPLIQQTVETVMTAIGAVVGAVLAVIASLFQDYGSEQLSVVDRVWNTARTVIETVLNTILGIIRTIMLAINGDWAGAWQELQNVVGTLWGGISTIVSTWLGDVGTKISTWLAGVKTWWDEHVAGVTGTVTGFTGGVQNIFQGFIDWINNLIGPWMAMLEEWWNQHGANVQLIVQTAWSFIQNIVQTVSGVIQGIINTFLGFIANLWKSKHEEVKSTTNSVWTTIQTIFSTVTAAIGVIVNTVVEVMKTAWELWKTNFEAITKACWDALKIAFDTALKVLGDIVDALAALLKGDWEGFRDNMMQITTDLWEGIKGLFNNAINTLGEITSNIVNAITSKFDIDWAKIGSNIVDGIKNGLAGAKQALIDEANRIAEGLPNWMKKILGIGSPSKVFMEIGSAMMSGLALGMSNEGNTPLEALNAVVRDISALMTPALDSVVAGVGQLAGINTRAQAAYAGAGNVSTENVTYNLSVPQPIGSIDELRATLQALRMARGG